MMEQSRLKWVVSSVQLELLPTDSLQVHIIDKNGKFLRFLDIVCSNPMQLALDEEDSLYIADTHGNIKMVEYIERCEMERIWRFVKEKTFRLFKI